GNYFSQTETVTSKKVDRSNTFFLNLEVCMEETTCGKPINLKNIHYDLDKYFIREDAKAELNKLVQFMKDNPSVRVELASHTDSRASDDYNKTLSQNRANAAVEYLVSRGINKARLKPIGYGETQLLNKCSNGIDCTEPQHQTNRRTEMKVICP
nr:OmpA family protein [Chryseobacterium sp.]